MLAVILRSRVGQKRSNPKDFGKFFWTQCYTGSKELRWSTPSRIVAPTKGGPRAPVIALVLGLAVLCLGCKSTYKHEGELPQNLLIDTSAPVYVLAPADYTSSFQTHPASGHLTGLVLQNALSFYFKNVTLGEGVEPFSNHWARAQSLGCKYFFRPVLEGWEEHETQQSGMRDRVWVRVTLLEVPAMTTLNDVLLKARSRWFGASEDDAADDLLVGLYRGYVRNLVGENDPIGPPKPSAPVKFPRLYDDF